MHQDKLKTVAVAAMLLAAACSTRTYGSGIGQLPVTPVPRPQPLSLAVTQVYLTDADSSQDFIQLKNVGADAQSLAGLQLCDGLGAGADCVDLSGSLDPGAYQAVSGIDGWGLSPNAGDVGVVTADGVVGAYVAWGADPGTVGSSLIGEAIASNAATPGDFIPAAFPMPAATALVRDGSTQGCAAPNANGAATGVTPCTQPAPVLCLSGLMLPASDTAESSVTLSNQSASGIELNGVRICWLPGCVTLGPTASIGATATLTVHFATAAQGATSDLYYPDTVGLSDAGDVAVLRPGTAQLDEPAQLQSFVRYGDVSGSDVLDDAAVAAGLWPSTDASVTASAGDTLVGDCSAAPGPGAWSVSPPAK